MRRSAGCPEPEPCGRSGGEVLDEHVGPLQQRVEHARDPRILEIERNALLAPVEPDEIARLAVHRSVVRAGEVARARPLDLDDPRPEVGELPGGERRRDRLLKGDDGDAVEDRAPC